MKQLHNIVAPLILFCLMAAVSLPVLAQEQEGETVAQQTQDENTPKEMPRRLQEKDLSTLSSPTSTGIYY